MTQEDLQVAGIAHRLIHSVSYDRALRSYRKLEPRLHEAVRESLTKEIEGGHLDEIPGTGGWSKGRVPSPSRGIGKSGGFRVIYLFFRVQQDIYLQTVYDHRNKADLNAEEKQALKAAAQAIKKTYSEE